MTRILIPRSDNSSSKIIEASDWEKYFTSDIIENYVVSGLAVTAQCPNILAVDVGVGSARLLGHHVLLRVLLHVLQIKYMHKYAEMVHVNQKLLHLVQLLDVYQQSLY